MAERIAHQPTGSFSGLLVIELTHVLNDHSGTNILCDLGARIVKIGPLGRAYETRAHRPFQKDSSLYFNFVNRGRETIVLNLREDADRAIFLNMVCRADVLTEDFRPGTMKHLGLSYDELSKINPRLIYAASG